MNPARTLDSNKELYYNDFIRRTLSEGLYQKDLIRRTLSEGLY
jgi:hypothetical protein